MRIGVTGHQRLDHRLRDQSAQFSEAEAWDWVKQQFLKVLTTYKDGPADLTVVSCLAAGADQLLSRLALAHGAAIDVVIPCVHYEESFSANQDRASFEALVPHARQTTYLPFPEPSEEAFFAGGKAVVNQSDMLLAVWDERGADGLGGTSDVVGYAIEHGTDVLIMNPISGTCDLRASGHD